MVSAAYSMSSSFVCVQYMYQRGTITGMSAGTYHVRYSLLALRKMYSGTGTLVPRAAYFRSEQAPVDVRGG